MPNTNIIISELSDLELDAVAAGNGWTLTQLSALNTAVGVQVAPQTNIALLSAGVGQGGTYQQQIVNAGNMA